MCLCIYVCGMWLVGALKMNAWNKSHQPLIRGHVVFRSPTEDTSGAKVAMSVAVLVQTLYKFLIHMVNELAAV